jgi:putative tricarboxylic transport membrane protein
MVGHLLFLFLATVSMPAMMRVIQIKRGLWPPLIVVAAMFGAFAVENRYFGVLAVLVFGVVGILLRFLDFPLPPVLLGFVLGPILERNVVRMSLVAKGDILGYVMTRPFAVVLLSLALLAILFDAINRVRKSRVSTKKPQPVSS